MFAVQRGRFPKVSKPEHNYLCLDLPSGPEASPAPLSRPTDALWAPPSQMLAWDSLILWAPHFLLIEVQKSGSLPSFLVSVRQAKQAVFLLIEHSQKPSVFTDIKEIHTIRREGSPQVLPG